MKHGHGYPVQLFWSDEDGGYIALVPDLPGCSAFGQSAADVLIELDDAIHAWIAAATAAGNPIPSPSAPLDEPQHSGKILLRLPRSLHARLSQDAKREDVSLNQHVLNILAAGSAAAAVQAAVVKSFAALNVQVQTAATTQPTITYLRGPRVEPHSPGGYNEYPHPVIYAPSETIVENAC